MNELIGIKKTEEEQPNKKQLKQEPTPVAQEQNPVVQEPNPVVKEQNPVVQEPNPVVKEQNPVVQEPNHVVQEPNPVVQEPNRVVQEPNPVVKEQKPEPIPVPVQPSNPIFSFLQTPKEEVLRIEKIESNPEPTDSLDEMPIQRGPEGDVFETDELDYELPDEYVLFRIYSPYYEIYETLFTDDYLKSIGLTTERNGMLGGGEQESTFPYNLFKAIFSNTFGRFGNFFQPKKESLAEETIKKSENVLASVSNFKTEELLKPREDKTAENTENKVKIEHSEKNTPPYYEIKIPKSGPVLSQQEYNEQKHRDTNDEILEHDGNGKTFQEILSETRQDEIQRTRKQILLAALDVSLPPDSSGKTTENIVDTIKRLEKKNASIEKVWFIRQRVVLNDDYANYRQPTYKWIKLDLGFF